MNNLSYFKNQIIAIISKMNEDEIFGLLDQGENDKTEKAKRIKDLHRGFSKIKCLNCTVRKLSSTTENECEGNCDKYCTWLNQKYNKEF